MSNFDDYLGRVQFTVWEAAAFVSRDAIARVQNLVDHGEPAEGLLTLAWCIVNEDVRVPRSVIAEIRRNSERLIPLKFMPPSLDAHALPD